MGLQWKLSNSVAWTRRLCTKECSRYSKVKVRRLAVATGLRQFKAGMLLTSATETVASSFTLAMKSFHVERFQLCQCSIVSSCWERRLVKSIAGFVGMQRSFLSSQARSYQVE